MQHLMKHFKIDKWMHSCLPKKESDELWADSSPSFSTALVRAVCGFVASATV